MQSKDYSWEEEKHGRTHRRLEQELNEKIDGFVNVMKNVLKKKNKRKSPSNDSDLHCYRFQTRDIALVTTEESSKSKRLRMETSTPLGSRNRNLIQIDSSPVDRLETEDMNLGNTLDSSQEGSTPQPGICLLEKNLECLEVTPPEAETEALSTAKNIITANSFMDSSDAYRNRMNSLPSRLSAVIAPQSGTGGRNRSASMGDIDMDISEWNSDDFTREFGGTGRIYNEFWSEGDDYLVDIPYLFRDQETISREQVEQEVESLVLQKSKNVLYDIFKEMCGNVQVKTRARNPIDVNAGAPVAPEKRKASSQPESSKDNPTGAACEKKRKKNGQQPVGQRSRLQSVGGGNFNIRLGEGGQSGIRRRTHSTNTKSHSSARKSKARPTSMPGEGQYLLTQLWKKSCEVSGKNYHGKNGNSVSVSSGNSVSVSSDTEIKCKEDE